MSLYIQIPNQKIQKLTQNCKFKQIMTYAYIRSQIKDNSYKASITQAQLSELCQVNERTIRRYVKSMKDNELFLNVEYKHGKEEYPYAVYQMEKLDSDFSMISPKFLEQQDLSIEEKGFLLLIKTHCIAGTNHFVFGSYEKLADLLHMDDEKLKKMVADLIEKKQVKIIGKVLIIINPYILLIEKKDIYNLTYLAIYYFCWQKGVVPPCKNDTQKKNLGIIIADYPDPQKLFNTLKERFKSLPSEVTLSYFAEGLRNMHAIKKEPSKTIFTL